MSEEIDKHILRKYEICAKLGKGVSKTRATNFVGLRIQICNEYALNNTFWLGIWSGMESSR